MTAHRCDVPDRNDVARLRMLRGVKAMFDRDVAAMQQVVDDIAGCEDCWRRTWGVTLGYAFGQLAQNTPDARMAIELQLAAAEADHDE